VSGQLSSLNGENLTNTDLFALIPTPNSTPGDMVHYQNTSIGGRIEISSALVDTINLQFMDEFGFPLKGLKEFVISILIDRVIPTPLPAEDRYRLDHARKMNAEATREHIRKKIRF
jgi:hypothetical protein